MPGSTSHCQLCCDSRQGQHAHALNQEGPDLSLLEPALKKQWDHAANAWLGNIVVKPYSNKKVSWICDQCPDGHVHSWSAAVSTRSKGLGCPQCSGHQVCQHNSLATKAPLVAAQWDYAANDETPDDVVAHSSHKFYWHCHECGRKWSATANSRVGKSKTGCPQCAQKASSNRSFRHPTFAQCKHPLLTDWDYQRNAARGNSPDNTTLRSAKQIFWLCTKCPAGQEHSWSAQPHHRTGRRQTSCPFCAGRNACRCNSLQALYPDTAAEWDLGKNHSQPSDYPASSKSLAWWSSPQRGSWQQTIDSRTSQVQQKTARLKRIQERQSSLGRFAFARPSPGYDFALRAVLAFVVA
ncbi:hypothetical protein ABBQ32_013305 [Trebouxia sp. C0010 RCD-2024]